MNIQNQNSFDFVPKSDYNEKWNLENKWFFQNQQFAERGTRRKVDGRTNYRTRDLYRNSKDRFKMTTDENPLNQRSGDWKQDEDIIEHRLGSVAQKSSVSNWKCKHLYSSSNFDPWGRSIHTLDNCSKSWLCDGYNKGDDEKNYLQNLREYIVNYQESYGVPRTEYSFSALIRMMGQATGRSLLALLYVMLNIVPLAEVFLYVLRFVVDKVISIKSSKDMRQKTIRCFVFTTELLSVYICLIFIFGFIVLPILHMVIGIIAKVMLCN